MAGGWCVYLLACSDGTIYTGVSNHLPRRLEQHRLGRGAAYTRSRRPLRLIHVEASPDRSSALRRELAIKRLARREKLRLVCSKVEWVVDDGLLTAAGFGAPHAFSTRAGGHSSGPFRGLNLGRGTGDDELSVQRNRRRFLAALRAEEGRVCALEQVHGAEVVEARSEWFERRADAAVSDDPSLLLVIATADCLPILYFDPVTGAVGAAHCGWRGTLAGLAGAVVAALRDRFGSRSGDLRVALGPAIGSCCYQVGPEVREAFASAGFPEGVSRPDGSGRYLLDLAAANRHCLARAGVAPEQVSEVGGCTACDSERFYSYRRDGGVTGRHWAAVRAPGEVAAVR